MYYLLNLIGTLKDVSMIILQIVFGSLVISSMPFSIYLAQKSEPKLTNPQVIRQIESDGSIRTIKDEIKKLQIVTVHSYGLDDSCSIPQRIGFDEVVSKIVHLAYPKLYQFRDFYLEAKTRNRNEISLNKAVSHTLNRIHDLKPQYVFVTDDVAFETVGIPLAEEGYKIIASGINIPWSDILKKYPNINKNNIILIQESVNLDPFFKIIDQVKFIPSKYWVIYDDTETSYALAKDYERQLFQRNVEYIKVTNIEELKKFILSTQNEKPGVFIIAAQSLLDSDTNRYVTNDIFFKEFINNNKIHLELSYNVIYAKYGLSICVGTNYKNMASDIAQIFMSNYFRTDKFENKVIFSKTYVSINTLRLKQLGFYNMAKVKLGLISEEFDSITQ